MHKCQQVVFYFDLRYLSQINVKKKGKAYVY